MKKIFDTIFSTSFAGLYMLIFAFAIGAATFIENDYGTDTAQQVIFQSRWFELLLLLFAISLVVNIAKYRMYRREKWAVFLYHISIIIILAGAATTRYTGYEGVMPIREGASNNQILLNQAFLQTSVFDGEKGLLFENKVLFGSWFKNNFKKTYRTPKGDVDIELLEFIPNAVETVEDDADGKMIMELVIAGVGGERKDIFFSEGDVRLMGGYLLSFDDLQQKNTIQFKYENDSLFFKATEDVAVMRMATMAKDTFSANAFHPFGIRTLHSFLGLNLVMKNYHEKAKLSLISNSFKVDNTNGIADALVLQLTSGEEEKTITVTGMKGALGQKKEFEFLGQRFFVAYGSKYKDLPFSLRLNDFELERYPGSNSPASYASEVTLLDGERGISRDQRIYMNHVLDHRGYRFFQSSYDPDEKGTLLSVNHDYWGTLVTYIGYFFLALGMLFSLFLPKGRFIGLSKKVIKLKEKRAFLLVLALGVQFLAIETNAQETNATPPIFSVDSLPVIDLAHANDFSRIVVQDFQGRMKPIHTLASELVRKVSSKVKIYGQNPTQMLISMTAFPNKWQHAPLIKIEHPDIAKLLNISKDRKTLGDYMDKEKEVRASFLDFIDEKGQYVLTSEIEKASRLTGKEQTIYHKELLKIDERMNILQGIFATRFLRIFPREVPIDTVDTYWDSPLDIVEKQQKGEKGNIFTDKFFMAYTGYVQSATKNGDWSDATQFVDLLHQYQLKLGKNTMPSAGKINAEIAYNKSGVFGWLILVYFLFGFLLFILLIAKLFKPYRILNIPIIVCFVVLGLGYLAHTWGLGARWYILGRAPWSNAYESLVYIAWASMTAGLVFARRSSIAFAGTAILGAATLAVAGLSMMNPELSPLVPVLKSYWLSIHVSMIVASYGFFALGGFMGMINLLLMIFNYKGGNKNILRTIKELTYINELTLTVGLYMMAVGTFLGGIWANESWGRYWGWDSKETWALVVVLVYAFVLHMRMIPGYRGRYAFNLASLLAYATVLMTYFGVNYYLSGLHSYAAGDPVPIPVMVYYVMAGVAVLAIAAFIAQGNGKKNGQV